MGCKLITELNLFQGLIRQMCCKHSAGHELILLTNLLVLTNFFFKLRHFEDT